MVKTLLAQAKEGSRISVVSKGRVAPRSEMKRKLPLPPPFLVSRGYTPEYPWLGQDHPEPRAPRPGLGRRWLLLPGLFKSVFCILAVIIALVLIFYGAHGIIKSVSAPGLRPAPQPSAHHSPRMLLPHGEALVQDRLHAQGGYRYQSKQ